LIIMEIKEELIKKNGNNCYTVSVSEEGIITIKKAQKDIELDLMEYYDSGEDSGLWNTYSEMNALLDGEKKLVDELVDESIIEIIVDYATENFYDYCFGTYLKYIKSYFDPTTTKKKLRIFAEILKPTSIFRIMYENEKKTINGVFLDIAINNDFKNVYENGIEIDMPRSKEIYQNMQKFREKDELEDYDTESEESHEKEIRNEISQLISESINLMNGTAEFILKGMYVISNNQLHYLSKEKLDNEYGNTINYPTLRIIQETIEDTNGLDITLKRIKNLLDDDTRLITDIMRLEETGETIEEILLDYIIDDTDRDYITIDDIKKVKVK